MCWKKDKCQGLVANVREHPTGFKILLLVLSAWATVQSFDIDNFVTDVYMYIHKQAHDHDEASCYVFCAHIRC